MSDKTNDSGAGISRRSVLTGAGAAGLGGLAAAAGGAAQAQAPGMAQRPPQTTPTDFTDGGVHFRSESNLRDCEVEGTIPEDLAGAFYRVGPDPQYPFRFPENIAFDGEGHVGAFFFRNGHVDFVSKYPKTQRYLAQAEAREALFGMYRNPLTNDPRVEGVSQGTANTNIIVHHGKLFALKEDSPPVAMDPLTLETTDNMYAYDREQYPAMASSAHPKIDPVTGEMISFGYEAKGIGTDDLYVYSVNPQGQITWEAWVKVPYACMIHDFAVTQSHIGFFVIPMQVDMAQMRAGGVHFSYDSSLPSYLGVMRRGGDGSDLMWLKGPERMSTHTMGAWSDGDKFYFDMDMGTSNQFPFFPNVNGEAFNPITAGGYVSRMTVDFSNKEPRPYDIETMYPDFAGYLPRQDDRYQTLQYRYGFMPGTHPTEKVDERLARGAPPRNSWVMFDHADRSLRYAFSGPETTVDEMTFIPRSADAPEGDGYLTGVAHNPLSNTSELLLFDTAGLEDGPIARVKLPYRVFGQIHGWWTPASEIPGWDDAV